MRLAGRWRACRLWGQVDEEVASVHGEKGREEVEIGDLARVDAVAVAAGAGVDANVLALGGEKRSRTLRGIFRYVWGNEGRQRSLLIIEIHECLEQIGACPRIAWVFLGG